MSEEEIKENIKDFLELNEIHSNNSIRRSFLTIYQEAIQGLLGLYNKEKEKNKELEKNRKVSQNFAKTVAEDYISKDKIREKIKECESIINKQKYNEYEKNIEDYQEIRKDMLEELLEED